MPGLYSLFFFGLKPGLDFSGGSRLELTATTSAMVRQTPASALSKVDLPSNIASQAALPSKVQAEKIKKYFDQNKLAYERVEAQGANIVLRLKEIDEERKNELLKGISQNVVPVVEQRFETLGPLLGQELILKTLIGVALASILIALYIIYQFQDWLFGLCAILATVHDSLVILGVFSLLGKFLGIEIDTLFVTAVLTVLSFSVHDTIVVYDRIREKLKLMKTTVGDLSLTDFEKIIDLSTNETLVRSLNNSLTVIFMLAALFILGGDSIRWFSLALLVGTVSGTYSSPFVAGPLLLVFKKLFEKRRK